MEQDSGATQSVWLDSASFPLGDSLSNFHVDVCIIGAGITGLSCAYRLCKEGRQVIVLDDGLPAGGETCRTTAHLASALDDRFKELERLHGVEGSSLAYQSHAAAIDRMEERASSENIQCDFQRVDGYLFLGQNQAESVLQDEFDAAVRAGFPGVKYPYHCPLDSITSKPCIRFPRQAQFDPIKYLAGLMKVTQEAGCKFITNQFVKAVEEKQSGIQITLRDDSLISADNCIVATNGPIVSLTMQLKQAPYRTYAIAAEVPVGSVPVALYWDTEDPYHYVRLMKGNAANGEKDLLIIGGEDHKTGMDHHPASRFESLYSWAKTRFAHIGDVKFEWSGQVMEPSDGLGFIGRAPGKKNLYVASGDSGMGMTHGTIASILIPDLIQGRSNPWETLYDPARISLRSLPSLVKENLTALPQLGKHLYKGEVKSAEEIPGGSGAIIRHGLKKVACYRADDGTLTQLSAMCTHLGCEVEWNDVEKSWDCPCHGSRFKTDGTVLNGPASKPLPAYKE